MSMCIQCVFEVMFNVWFQQIHTVMMILWSQLLLCRAFNMISEFRPALNVITLWFQCSSNVASIVLQCGTW